VELVVKTKPEASLDAEFAELYRQRERIQVRMDAIKRNINKKEYRVLVRNIGNP
jgi:DNA-binding sugar fermentation-stimulating protein